MKLKQVFVLSGIFILLMVGVFVRNLQKPSELVTEEYVPLNLSFEPNQIMKIKIKKGQAEPPQGARAVEGATQERVGIYTELVKDKNQRKVVTLSNAHADQKKIEDLLTELRQMKGELRGKGKELFGDFGIHEEGTFHILFQDAAGFPVLNLILGNKKANGSVFIRQKDSEEIYLTEANLFNSIGIYGDPEDEEPDSNYWAATELIPADLGKVKSVEMCRFRDGNKILTVGLVKDLQKKKWKYTQEPVPFALDSEKVGQFLNTVKSVRAQKALDPKARDYGFSKPTWQMKLGLESGEEIVVTTAGLDSKTNAYPVQVSTEPVVFQVPKYYLENLDVDDSKFFVNNPFNVEVGKIEKLIVHTDKTVLSFKPNEKKWSGLENYLNDLKNFKVTRLLFETEQQKKARSPASFAIEIQREGEPLQALEVGALISEASKEYAVLKRNIDQPFAISESVFKQLFENLDRLTEPKATA